MYLYVRILFVNYELLLILSMLNMAACDLLIAAGWHYW